MKKKSQDKKVSLYIPTLNSGKTIISCLKSVLAQDYNLVEILIIDNRSADDTVNKINKLKARSKIPIKIISQKKHGLADARNIAMMHSKGDIVGFIDAGMDIHPAGLIFL